MTILFVLFHITKVTCFTMTMLTSTICYLIMKTNLVNDETYISNVLFQINVIQYFDFLASDYEIKLRYPYQTVGNNRYSI